MLAHRLRRWPNITTIMGQPLVFTGMQLTSSLLISLWSLFNTCFDWGSIPSEWSKSILSSIPQCPRKDKCGPFNYRGISLLYNIHKLYSSILNQRLVAYMDNVDCLTGEQNGFRNHHLFEYPAFVLSNVISSNIDQNKPTFFIYTNPLTGSIESFYCM